MRYGSVCSGIEAASVAWEPLGWQPAWFSEIEPFPSAVLAHHWPEVPNLGDMLTLPDRVAAGEVEAPDVLVGGTPCQAFSVAGRRGSLEDERGALTLAYVELANAVDSRRLESGRDECVVVWENVPGVLNTKDNAFGCFLAGLVGETEPLVPAGKRWTNAGCVCGPQRTVAWRVLDAQFFGVAQRRRRVFVVASARAGFDPVEVLLEREGVRRDSPPRREAGQDAARHAAGRIDCTGKAIAGTVSSKWAKGTGGPAGDEHYNLAVVDAVPLLEPGARTGKSTTDLRAGIGIGQDGDPMFTLQAGKQYGVACAATGDITHTLNTANNGKGCSEDGTGRGVPTIAFQPGNLRRGAGAAPSEDVFPTVKADYGRGLSDQFPHVATCFVQNSRSEVRQVGGDGQIVGALAAESGAQQQNYVTQSTADTLTSSWHESGGAPAGNNPGLLNPVFHGLAVRRLTPVECERLQGFPDDHTAIPPWYACKCGHTFPEELGKYGCPNCLGENSARLKTVADGPRYKAIGNSMAVPVMHWIGERIDRQIALDDFDLGFGS